MTEAELEKAFLKLDKKDLEGILKELNKDSYISRLIKAQTDLLIVPENINKRLIEEATECIKVIIAGRKKLENDISRYSFGINFQNTAIREFLSLLSKAFDKFLPLFIKQKLYKEGVRFTCAIVTVVHTSNNNDVKELSYRIDFNPYYKKLIKEGNLNQSSVLRFRDEYEDRSYITALDIFTSDKIQFEC